MSDLTKTLWKAYQKQILGIVKEIAKDLLEGKIPRDKDAIAKLFQEQVKDLLDRDKDGKINFDDVPLSVINFLQELAYQLFRSLGDSDEKRIEALGRLLGD